LAGSSAAPAEVCAAVAVLVSAMEDCPAEPPYVARPLALVLAGPPATAIAMPAASKMIMADMKSKRLALTVSYSQSAWAWL